MKYCVIIPARYESTRLPGKPLIELEGIPMVLRTYRQCIKACSPEDVYIATEDTRIRDLCLQHNIQVIMTSESCLTGTDRIAECIQHVDADVYVNIQGDEPVFNPSDLKQVLESIKIYPGEIINGYSEIEDESLFRSVSVPKVVFRPDGRLLYMSRSPIPSNKELSFERSWRQICVYAFPKDALIAFSAIENKTLLESIEDIEILRFLELGWDIRMIPLSNESIAVDNPDDIIKVEKAIRERGL